MAAYPLYKSKSIASASSALKGLILEDNQRHADNDHCHTGGNQNLEHKLDKKHYTPPFLEIH
jgi:hypothetical protein